MSTAYKNVAAEILNCILGSPQNPGGVWGEPTQSEQGLPTLHSPHTFILFSNYLSEEPGSTDIRGETDKHGLSRERTSTFIHSFLYSMQSFRLLQTV